MKKISVASKIGILPILQEFPCIRSVGTSIDSRCVHVKSHYLIRLKGVFNVNSVEELC